MGNSCFLTCPRRAAAFPHMPPVDNSCSLTASHTRRGPRVFRRNNLCEARAGSERPEHDRGADAAEDGGQIGDGADGGVVVARFVLPGEHRFRGNGFRGKNGADAAGDAGGAEPGADSAGEGAAVGFRNIRHLNQRGIDLAARAHGTHHRDIAAEAAEEELHLRGQRIDRVDREIEAGFEQAVDAVALEELHPGEEGSGGIDFAHSFGDHLRLGAAEGRGERGELAVAVGEFEAVAVDEGEGADSGAGELFGGVGADAADAEHQHVGAAEPLQLLFSEQEAGAFETGQVFRLIHRCRNSLKLASVAAVSRSAGQPSTPAARSISCSTGSGRSSVSKPTRLNPVRRRWSRSGGRSSAAAPSER